MSKCNRVHTHAMSTLRISSGIDCERPHKPWAWLHAHSWDILAMVPMSASLFGPTSSKRIGNVSVNTLPSSVNSLAAQCGTCSIIFFASSSSPTEEVAAPVAFVFLTPPLLFVLSFLLVKLLLLLLVIANEDDRDEAEEEEEEASEEEAEHFGIRLLLVVAVIMRRGGAQCTVVVGTEVVISISLYY